MSKKLVVSFTMEAGLTDEELTEVESLSPEKFGKAIDELIEEIHDTFFDATVTSHDVRIVDDSIELNNPEYTPELVSKGMRDEAQGLHIHVTGEPDAREVSVVTDMTGSDVAHLLVAVLNDLMEGDPE